MIWWLGKVEGGVCGWFFRIKWLLLLGREFCCCVGKLGKVIEFSVMMFLLLFVWSWLNFKGIGNFWSMFFLLMWLRGSDEIWWNFLRLVGFCKNIFEEGEEERLWILFILEGVLSWLRILFGGKGFIFVVVVLLWNWSVLMGIGWWWKLLSLLFICKKCKLELVIIVCWFLLIFFKYRWNFCSYKEKNKNFKRCIKKKKVLFV